MRAESMSAYWTRGVAWKVTHLALDVAAGGAIGATLGVVLGAVPWAEGLGIKVLGGGGIPVSCLRLGGRPILPGLYVLGTSPVPLSGCVWFLK